MDSQNWKMHGIFTDWLIQVCVRFQLLPITPYLTVNIIDCFLSARVVSFAKLQLVGITCMFLVAKVEEIVASSVVNFLYCADASTEKARFLKQRNTSSRRSSGTWATQTQVALCGAKTIPTQTLRGCMRADNTFIHWGPRSSTHLLMTNLFM